jgi:hypothetical protein
MMIRLTSSFRSGSFRRRLCGSRRPAGAFVAGLVAVLMVTGIPSAGRASLLFAMDLPALAARADHVVVCEVRSVTSAWSPDRRHIYTRVDADVVETWRTTGARSMARVSIWQPGGAVGDLELLVPGLPRFVTGERAVLFLRGAPERATVVGGTLGMLPIRTDASASEPLVWAPRLEGTSLIAAAGGAGATVPARPMPLARFRAEVAAAFAKRGVR